MIQEYLKKGRANASSRAKLCELTGLSPRELRLEIAKEREAGALILSDSGTRGYYLPGSVEELESYVRQMETRAKKIFISSRAARQEIKRMKDDEKKSGRCW